MSDSETPEVDVRTNAIWRFEDNESHTEGVASMVVACNGGSLEPPLAGDESVVAEVTNVEWPKLLDPVDDLPPATIITSVRYDQDKLVFTGVAHDNGTFTSDTVNGQPAT